MDSVCVVFVTALILFFSTVVLIFYQNRFRLKSKSRNHQLPLGSMGWPFIGETADYVSSAYNVGPDAFMDKRRSMYGKVFKSHIFGSPTIVSMDAEVNRFVLQSDAAVFVPSYPKSVSELMGEFSILSINGSLHRRIHGLVGGFFKSHQLKSQITKEMQNYIQQSMANWSEDRPVFIQDVTKSIAFQLLVKALISLDPGDEMDLLRKHFQEFISGFISLPINLPGSKLYRSLQAKKKMIKLVQKIIQAKRDSGLSKVPKDVVDVLLNDASEHFTDKLIADNVIDMMIPGEDSVPVLVAIAIKYLSECPLALQQLTEENMKLKRLKDQQGEPLSWSDYMSLPFTQTVITETLRMGNIIMGVFRKAMKDVEIKGILIPKGWCVFTYFRSVHLDDSNYDHPYQFNPWRWQNKDMSSCSFTPFGGGLRLCPGLDLSRLEASIFLHHFVTQFRWSAEEDTIVNFPTVRMKRRMPIWIERVKD
ncbi:3-epi-6-deoxocathasterone 23-monooxygenase CYP90D1-like [Neltuma alba]|uniref:3-epi-6-deoxocathasterone 23-monooxygenase CYP90D1-like n=1 Tax=Neltuma alba TaxID=207710 RepID=UPI0010A3B304|nr:3-epi-6-deoxocathasterone 23-monooxygenase CYP90D1-like [Prosopis alba]